MMQAMGVARTPITTLSSTHDILHTLMLNKQSHYAFHASVFHAPPTTIYCACISGHRQQELTSRWSGDVSTPGGVM